MQKTHRNTPKSCGKLVQKSGSCYSCIYRDVIKVPVDVIVHILSSDDYIVGTHFVSNEVALLGNHADDKVTRLSILM